MNQFSSVNTSTQNKKITILLCVFFIFSFLYSIGQTGIQWCGSDIMRQKNFDENPRTKQKNDSLENALFLLVQQQFQQKKSGIGPPPSLMQIYTIPVVVHIIHNNGPENIPDAQVIAGMQHLNDAFRNVGYYDPSTGVDVEIEFCLAKQDENGNPSTGIDRVVSALTNMTMETDDISLKNLLRWNPTKYLNIWIVKEITSQSMGTGVAGYAYFPSSHGNVVDGIVNEANYFGSTPDKSKVAVHEMGHYLGLYHTFEGGCSNNNCFIDGDKVCDTPPDGSTAPVSCGGAINTCQTDDDDLTANNPFRPISNGGQGDQNDMFINYMDYGYQTCQSAFTLGQKNRMIPSLTGERGSLLQSSGCNPPCINPITASFSASATNVTAGTAVSFSNTSTGATGYIWQLNGTTFSTATNPSYTFNMEGTYTIKLTAANNNPSCTKGFTITITVTCPVATPSFTVSSNTVSPGDNVTFTNTSAGANSYQWFIDGIAQSSTTNFNHTFPTAGGFMVSLTASNGICSKTFYQNVSVGFCRSKQANKWYFGDSLALDFNSGSPVALTNSAMNTILGSSSISDENGSLLFYSNGETVWNSSHAVMQNGAGLWGNKLSTQSALIVKQPGSNNLYYLFTTDARGGKDSASFPSAEPGAFAYSIIDISANGGLGAVISKNNLVYTFTSEKQAAVKHANGTDIWIVTHKYYSDKFYAHLLTCSGFNSSPVESQTGLMYGIPYGSSGDAVGTLTISPDGKRLAIAKGSGGIYTAKEKYQIFDFNTSTGIVSNPITISVRPNETATFTAFSPDGSKFYCAGGYTVNTIYQFDLNAGSHAAIDSSATALFSGHAWGMALAPDGKIYVNSGAWIVYPSVYNCFLSAIQIPNAPDTLCSYTSNVVSVPSGANTFPNFLVDYLAPLKPPTIRGQDILCSANEATYCINKRNCGLSNDTVSWLLQGNASILHSNDTSVTIHFNQPGADTLIVLQKTICGIVSDTLFINVISVAAPIVNLGNDTSFCSASSITLYANTSNSYLWSSGDTVQSISVSIPGIYWVEVSNSSGCIAADTIRILSGNTIPPIDLGNDINVCAGKIIVLDAGSGFSSYKWQDGSTSQKHTVYLPGKYWVTVSSCGNFTSDTITVSSQSNIPFTIAQEGSLCGGQSVALKAAPSNLASYIWDNGSSNYIREVQLPGTYWLMVTDANGCFDQDSVDVILQDCNCVIAIPNAFSPNNDGHSDLFILHGFENCVSSFSFVIFDRWGEKVFETEDVAKGWDGTYKGKPMNATVYVYSINATLMSGEKISKKGNISLIR